MRILALDLGSKCGWATLDTEGRFEVESGVQDFSLVRGESPGMRYLRFRAWLAKVLMQSEAVENHENLAWAAGFFDGEGCTTTSRAYQKTYVKLDGTESVLSADSISVIIHQNHPEVLVRFRDVVKIGKVGGPYQDKRHLGTQYWQYRISGVERVRQVLALIWPWLGSQKRDQATCVLGKKLVGEKRSPQRERIGLVAYEAAHHRGGAATEVALGFATNVQAACALYGWEHTTVHSATLKKHVTGSGRASKDAVVAAMRLRWGREVEDDNEADALAVLAWAVDTIAVKV